MALGFTRQTRARNGIGERVSRAVNGLVYPAVARNAGSTERIAATAREEQAPSRSRIQPAGPRADAMRIELPIATVSEANRRGFRPWTAEEDQVVRSMYATHTRAQIAEVLVGRSEPAVRMRCFTLRLAQKVRCWTDEEVDALRGAYSRGSDRPVKLAELATMLGRDRHNVCRKARELGLTNAARKKVDERKAKANKFENAEDRRAAMSEARKEWIAQNGHPRGALGMKHSKETIAIISASSKRAWSNPASGLNSETASQKRSDLMTRRIVAGEMNSGYSRSRGGKRDDLGGVYFRSAWEANYARYLNFLLERGEIAGWAFEPKTFEFTKIKRGTRAYTPDFRVDLVGGGHEWHEVKGWMDDKSKTRLSRFARYYPAEKLIVIDQAWFRSANKTIARMLPNWERGTVHAPK